MLCAAKPRASRVPTACLDGTLARACALTFHTALRPYSQPYITLLVPYVWALWAYAMAGITFTSNIRVEGDSVILDYKTRDGLTSL